MGGGGACKGRWGRGLWGGGFEGGESRGVGDLGAIG